MCGGSGEYARREQTENVHRIGHVGSQGFDDQSAHPDRGDLRTRSSASRMDGEPAVSVDRGVRTKMIVRRYVNMRGVMHKRRK